MIVKILGHTLRKDNSIMRFSVEFPQLNATGSYGVQIELPATKEQFKSVVKKRYLEVQQRIIDSDLLREQYSEFLDREINLS